MNKSLAFRLQQEISVLDAVSLHNEIAPDALSPKKVDEVEAKRGYVDEMLYMGKDNS